MKDLFTTPKTYVRQIDWLNQRALCAPMSRKHYQTSIFLDDRLQAAGPEFSVPVEALYDALAQRASVRNTPLHYIFHTTFCGSTLLCHALDRLGVCLVYKEPYLLHDLAFRLRRGWPLAGHVDTDAYFDLVVALLGRTYRPNEVAVIKPSDSCNTLAPRLLKQHEGSRAVLLYADLGSFLISNLHHAMRKTHLMRTLPRAQHDLAQLGYPASATRVRSEAEAAAAVWYSLMAQHQLILEAAPLQVKSLCASDLYANPFDSLCTVSDFFGLTHSAGFLRRQIANGPFRQDAKAQSRAYDRDAAADLKRQRAEAYAAPITAAQNWVSQVHTAAAASLTLKQSLLGDIERHFG